MNHSVNFNFLYFICWYLIKDLEYRIQILFIQIVYFDHFNKNHKGYQCIIYHLIACFIKKKIQDFSFHFEDDVS